MSPDPRTCIDDDHARVRPPTISLVGAVEVVEAGYWGIVAAALDSFWTAVWAAGGFGLSGTISILL